MKCDANLRAKNCSGKNGMQEIKGRMNVDYMWFEPYKVRDGEKEKFLG